MKNIRYFYCCLLILFSIPSITDANVFDACKESTPIKMQEQFSVCQADLSQIKENSISVAIRHAPPFIYETQDSISGDKKLRGIAVDFWEEIAERLNISYHYTCLSLPDTLENLENGHIDVAISPLTITKNREQRFDFSHQYFNSGLVFAAQLGESRFDFSKAFSTLKSAFSSQYVFYLLIIFFCFLFVFIVLALKNIKMYQTMPIMVGRSKPSMVFHIILYSVLNMCGIRQDVFGFSSIGMQFFSLLVLIFGITVSASLFGMVTASLTQSVTEEKEFSIDDIEGYKVATLTGSTAQNFLCSSPKKPAALTVTDTWNGALNQLASGKQDVVLGDWVQLTYLNQHTAFKKQIKVQGKSLQFEPYGWGLRNEFFLRDNINQELIEMLRNQTGPDIIRRYIGDKQIDIQIN